MPQLDATVTAVGAPCWIDLFTSDPDASVAFYGEIFRWTADAPDEEFGGYFTFHKDGVQVAGAMRNDGESGTKDLWNIYLASDDAEATTAATAEHGGGVIVPAMPVGDLGSMAVLTDAGGAAIGTWQPGTHKGFGVVNEPGAPGWFELHTRDFDASVKFYEDVFHWDTHAMSDTPEFRYTTLGEGDGAKAGIMDASAFLPEGVPAHWAVYFVVEDTDATLARVVELGGSILDPAMDTPFGRLATVADPTGAVFKLISNA